MKQYLASARNIILMLIIVWTAIFFVSFHAPKPQPAAINSPAIAEYQQSQYVRELLSPSTFTVRVKVFVSEKNKATQKEEESLCVQGVGTAYTVSENGYFSSSNHIFDPSSRQTECLESLAKNRNVPISALMGVRFKIEYIFTDANKISFPVDIVKTFPEIDLAVLKPKQKEASILQPLPPKWIPVQFRTGSPSIVDGKAVSGNGPFFAPDEPVAMMGTPLNLPFTLTKGTLGNNTFFEFGGIPFIHFVAPINSGNSGGPVISLLDFKFIGMAAATKFDTGKYPTSQAGAIPFWEIQKALKEIDMK
ncbi:MAG: serine protease [Candidatus Paceibacterota bacterium]|jgi:S1-C subfamily serine protease